MLSRASRPLAPPKPITAPPEPPVLKTTHAPTPGILSSKPTTHSLLHASHSSFQTVTPKQAPTSAISPIVEEPPSPHPSDSQASKGWRKLSKKKKKETEKPSKKKKKKKNEGKKHSVTKLEISAPTNFQHLEHVGWDVNGGFNAANLSKDWRDLLREAGVSEAQLQDRDTAQFIVNYVEQHGGIESANQHAPVKHVSTRARSQSEAAPRRAPPPPPPSRNSQ